jgi:trans-aconitate 2-methyltransferase
MANFTDIASHYRQSSLVQASAGAQLIELLGISGNHDILDVGCGTGNLSAELLKRTTGTVTGIDPSEGMIREASREYPDPRIRFLVMSDTEINFKETFDIIYCNSAFQWFKTPSVFLQKAYDALRPKGKIGIQAPTKENYCPVFLKAISDCCLNPQLKQVFSGFRSPWFKLETAEAYTNLFREAGFTVTLSTIEESRNRYSPEKVFDVFSSGAKAGYLNSDCYDAPLPEWFESTFLEGIKHSFKRQAETDGFIDLCFYRIFLIAEK